MSSTFSAPGMVMPRSVRSWTPRGPTRSPHALSRGNLALSTSATRAPPRASTVAAMLPAGPDPTTIASKCPAFIGPSTDKTLGFDCTPGERRGPMQLRATSDPNRFARALFTGLPNRYDLLAEVLSLGQNRRWRRAMVNRIVPARPHRLLDVATGTAGVALRLTEQTDAFVTGLDLTEAMLRRGQANVAANSAG